MSENHYDVIVVGGRCAGATLALRLGRGGLKVLLVDRATFPSLPSVPTSPFIQPSTMRLLDEMGFKEEEYAHAGSKFERFIIEFMGDFHVVLPTSRMMLDRNYCRGIDRSLFDHTLWKEAAATSGVTACEEFSVSQILKDEMGSVKGIGGKGADGAAVSYTADLVVGADGRFSFCAREFGAKVIEERNEYTTASYHAEWEDVEDYAPDLPNATTMYNSNKGFAVLMILIEKRKYIIGTYMKSGDAHFGGQGLEKAYYDGLQRFPHLWNRLKNAKRVTDIVGVRPIENGYREPYGVNWALVGDAAHYKDPIDGQGIYDALFGAKVLAESILDWKQNGTAWASAGARYQERLMAETHPVFEETVKRVKQNLYTEVPVFILKTLVRWSMSDPDYQAHYLRYLSRAVAPADFRAMPRNLPKVILNGIMRDIRRG